MNLILKITDGYGLKENSVKEFHQKGGSIGRGDSNDLVLFDPEKTISKLHAFIHYRNDQYHLTDVSTNGVFFNDDPVPVAQSADNPRLIHAGDEIRLGNYILTASLESSADQFTQSISSGEDNYDKDIEALLTGGSDDGMLLPKQQMKNDYRYDGKFGGIELHNNLGIEENTREAKHVAGDLSIDDFLNQHQRFDAKTLPSNSLDDLLDLDNLIESPRPSATPVMNDKDRTARLIELTDELLMADDSTRPSILAEINRLSR